MMLLAFGSGLPRSTVVSGGDRPGGMNRQRIAGDERGTFVRDGVVVGRGVELDVAWIDDGLGREICHREHDDQDNQRVMDHAQYDHQS